MDQMQWYLGWWASQAGTSGVVASVDTCWSQIRLEYVDFADSLREWFCRR